ncbi:MAG: hypothetical protein E7040_08340 [Lentisphaerae bacterium]|nr:hypothetical protein [Lentisphaerota bacterium]
MKKILAFLILLSALFLLPACQYAHGDGPDVATPRAQKNRKVSPDKNPRKSNWLTQNMHRERVSRKDINKPGGNDDFQVFPIRDGKRRSEKLREQGSPFFWR